MRFSLPPLDKLGESMVRIRKSHRRCFAGERGSQEGAEMNKRNSVVRRALNPCRAILGDEPEVTLWTKVPYLKRTQASMRLLYFAVVGFKAAGWLQLSTHPIFYLS